MLNATTSSFTHLENQNENQDSKCALHLCYNLTWQYCFLVRFFPILFLAKLLKQEISQFRTA